MTNKYSRWPGQFANPLEAMRRRIVVADQVNRSKKAPISLSRVSLEKQVKDKPKTNE
jgi:hypothetical protein